MYAEKWHETAARADNQPSEQTNEQERENAKKTRKKKQ